MARPLADARGYTFSETVLAAAGIHFTRTNRPDLFGLCASTGGRTDQNPGAGVPAMSLVLPGVLTGHRRPLLLSMGRCRRGFGQVDDRMLRRVQILQHLEVPELDPSLPAV